MEYTYWKTQTSSKPLFPDVEWSRPEQRQQAGRLGIIGGNKLGFAGVAESYSTALNLGVGQVRVLLPDALKKSIPPTISDTLFGATTPSGSLASQAKAEMQALGDWANGILMVGDAGRNSETAIVYEHFLLDYSRPVTITRDAFDLVKQSAPQIVQRPDTLMVLSFSQLQKLFQAVYYPKVLTFNIQLAQLVEALHKFTITYPVGLMVLHKEHLLVAFDGQVSSTDWQKPLEIWRGTVATKAAGYWLWNPSSLFEAASTSLVAQG